MNRLKQELLLFKSSLVAVLLVLAFGSSAMAQAYLSPKAEQWRTEGGGWLVLDGAYAFKQSDPESIRQGSITVQGPGYIGVVQRKINNSDPSACLRHANGAGFPTRSMGTQAKLKGADGKHKWEPATMASEDYKPNANKGGWVPAPTKDNPTLTLDVWVNVTGGGVKNDDRAIEYEFWYFPLEGGKLVKVTSINSKGKEVDVTADAQPPELETPQKLKDEWAKMKEMQKDIEEHLAKDQKDREQLMKEIKATEKGIAAQKKLIKETKIKEIKAEQAYLGSPMNGGSKYLIGSGGTTLMMDMIHVKNDLLRHQLDLGGGLESFKEKNNRLKEIDARIAMWNKHLKKVKYYKEEVQAGGIFRNK